MHHNYAPFWIPKHSATLSWQHHNAQCYLFSFYSISLPLYLPRVALLRTIASLKIPCLYFLGTLLAVFHKRTGRNVMKLDRHALSDKNIQPCVLQILNSFSCQISGPLKGNATQIRRQLFTLLSCGSIAIQLQITQAFPNSLYSNSCLHCLVLSFIYHVPYSTSFLSPFPSVLILLFFSFDMGVGYSGLVSLLFQPLSSYLFPWNGEVACVVSDNTLTILFLVVIRAIIIPHQILQLHNRHIAPADVNFPLFIHFGGYLCY